MKARAIPIRDGHHWHELRAEHLGGSEVAALFGEHPYLTHYELWHRKAGLVSEPDLSDNERVFWGQILEPAIAEGVKQKTGWGVRKVKRYYSMRPELGLGGSLDYEITGHPRGPGVLEIKTTDALVAKRWGASPPLLYELQLVTYCHLTDRRWGALAILIGGHDLRIIEYQERPQSIALIEHRVAEFWASIEAGTPPLPDYEHDHDTIAQLYSTTAAGKFLDMSGNNRLAELLADYALVTQQRRTAERGAKILRAELLMTIGDAEEVRCGEWRLKASSIARTRGTIITEDMVGRELKGREGYRSLHVARRQEEAA